MRLHYYLLRHNLLPRAVVVCSVVLSPSILPSAPAPSGLPHAPRPLATMLASALAATQDAPAVEQALGLDRPTRRLIQQALGNAGFDPGKPDGLFGPRTRAAIRRWQAARGVPETGYLDGTQARLLSAAEPRAGVHEPVAAAPPSATDLARQPAASPTSPSASGAAPAAQPQSAAASVEREGLYWQSIANSENPADYEAYLEQFPNGVFRALAENRLSGFRPEQMCAGKPAGVACWMEIDRQPGCFVWNSRFQSEGDRVTWTGECAGGVAQGAGVLAWVGRDGTGQTETGRIEDGKQTGHWVVRLPSGSVAEGPVIDGKEHGDWVFRFADGTVWEGPYVDGEQTGHWVLRFADGNVEEGSLVDGERNGYWRLRPPAGGVQEGAYVDGERSGHWFLHFASGNVEEGPFVDGERNGHWVLRFADGNVHEGGFVDGRRDGHWVLRSTTGRVTNRFYVDGEAVSPPRR